MGAQKLDIVQCLLRYRPDVDAHDDRDDTALHTAARTGNLDIVLVSASQILKVHSSAKNWRQQHVHGCYVTDLCNGMITSYPPSPLLKTLPIPSYTILKG